MHKIFSAKAPEEKIRQELLHFMTQTAGYPAGLIGVEVALASLPHLASQKKRIPSRRADIIVFSGPELKPLMLIECKAVPFTPQAESQIIGYNLFVKAPYLVLANHEGIKTAQYSENEGWIFHPGIPSYQQLF